MLAVGAAIVYKMFDRKQGVCAHMSEGDMKWLEMCTWIHIKCSYVFLFFTDHTNITAAK